MKLRQGSSHGARVHVMTHRPGPRTLEPALMLTPPARHFAALNLISPRLHHNSHFKHLRRAFIIQIDSMPQTALITGGKACLDIRYASG